MKEVETRLRELFIEFKPGEAEPSKIGNIIGALLSENGAYQFVDISTPSGKDYRRGIQFNLKECSQHIETHPHTRIWTILSERQLSKSY